MRTLFSATARRLLDRCGSRGRKRSGRTRESEGACIAKHQRLNCSSIVPLGLDIAMKLSMLVLILAALCIASVHAAEPPVIDVWPEGRVPGEPSGIGEEKEEPRQPGQREVKRIANVTRPTLTIF